MNDTPQGDGNSCGNFAISSNVLFTIRMNDTPQGDGNLSNFFLKTFFL